MTGDNEYGIASLWAQIVGYEESRSCEAVYSRFPANSKQTTTVLRVHDHFTKETTNVVNKSPLFLQVHTNLNSIKVFTGPWPLQASVLYL